jgi:hypothetical protein
MKNKYFVKYSSEDWKPSLCRKLNKLRSEFPFIQKVETEFCYSVQFSATQPIDDELMKHADEQLSWIFSHPPGDLLSVRKDSRFNADTDIVIEIGPRLV